MGVCRSVLQIPLFFFVNISPALYYLNAWNRQQATLQETTGIPARLLPPPTPAVRLSQSSLIHLRRSVQFLCVLVCPLSCYGHIFQRFLIINVVGDWVWILTCDNLPILVERCTLSFSDDHYTLWGWVGSRAFVFSLRCKTYESSSHF